MRKEHWALVALGVNLTQSLLKLVAGILTNSLSLTGEAFHSFSDSFVSLVAFFTIIFSERKSKKFPYGLYKLENVGAIVIGVLLLLVAYEVASRAFTQSVIVKREYLDVGLAVVVFSLLSSLTLSFLERRAGKKLNSPALIADSYHTLTDAFGSSIVLASLVAVYVGYQLDRYFALGVALLILYTAIKILKQEVSVLLDISADEKTLESIRDVILSFDQVSGIKHLFARSSGGKVFADITLTLKGRDFIRMHEVVDNIEKALLEAIPNLEMVFIHYEPEEDKTKVAILTDREGKVAQSFAKVKGAFVFEEGKGSTVLNLENLDEKEISKHLSSQGVNVIVCGQHPECSEAKAILSKEGIFVWETAEENPYKALSEVAYNLSNVKASDKKGQDNRPLSESR